jgi:hypothetical protein
MSAPRGSLWTEEAVDTAAKLWGQNKTAKQVAEALGPSFTKNMVISLANRARDRFPARKPLMETALNLPVDDIAKIWNECPHRSSADIGKEFGAKASTIRGLVTKHPGKFNPRPRGGERVSAKSKANKTARKSKTISTAWSRPTRDPAAPKIVYRNPDLDSYELKRLPFAADMVSNTGCKYPLTDTGPHMFCAHTRHEMKPYCAYHVVKCNPPGAGTGSEKRAHKIR